MAAAIGNRIMKSQRGSGLFWRLLRGFSTNETKCFSWVSGRSIRRRRAYIDGMGQITRCTFRELFSGSKGRRMKRI